MPMFNPTPSRLFGILDIETKPDPHAMALLRQSNADRSPLAIHRLTAASMISVWETTGGEWQDLSLVSVAEPDHSETTMLTEIDRFLLNLITNGGECVTFNGLSHDLPTLRRRASRHLLFDLTGVFPATPMLHTDLMRRCTRGWRDDWPSLRAACAGLGIPVNHLLAGNGGSGPSARQRKCEVDVVCTFLLLLYELSISRRTQRPIVAGWKAVRELFGSGHPPPHLAQFARITPPGSTE